MRKSQTSFVFSFWSPSQGLDLTVSVFQVGTTSKQSCHTALNLGATFPPWLLLLLLLCPLQPALQPSGRRGLRLETDQGSAALACTSYFNTAWRPPPFTVTTHLSLIPFLTSQGSPPPGPQAPWSSNSITVTSFRMSVAFGRGTSRRTNC